MGCLFILSIRLDRHAAPISSEGTGKLVVSLQPAGHSDHLLCPAQLPSALAPVAANGFIGINSIHPAYGGRKSTSVQRIQEAMFSDSDRLLDITEAA